MSNQEYLKYLFNEDLYLVRDESKVLQEENSKESEVAVNEPSPNTVIKKQSIPLLIFAEINGDKEKELLEKVLGAIGYKLEHIIVLKLQESHNYAPEKTIIFSDQKPLDQAYYQVLSSENGETLLSKSLGSLMVSIEDKKSLWSNLKTWFAIKS